MKNPRIKKTVIVTGYTCNNFCKFCVNQGRKGPRDRTTTEILQAIDNAFLRGGTYLEIIGGEQTIRADISTIINYAKKRGFDKIVMATNGRLLLYKQFAREVINAGLTEIIFSIHGHNDKIHDNLTRAPGSFKQLIKGINNVKEIGGCRIASNTTVVKENYKALPRIGQFIYKLGIRNAEFIFVDPTRGGAFYNFKELVPRISVVAPYAKKCLEIGLLNRIEHWNIRYVPLCYFEGYENQISEIYEERTFQSEQIAPDFVNSDIVRSRAALGRIKPPKCKGCKKYNICEGIWVEYFKRYGDQELIPFS